MNTHTLLISLMSLMSVSASAETVSLYDFEDQKPLNNVFWGVTETIESNPYSCGNTSKYCSKFEVSGYGLDGFNNTADLSKYILAVDVFANTDETVKCYHKAADKDLYQSCKAKKWNTLYFDFRSVANASSAGMIYFGGCASGAGTLYIDNIRLVTAEETAYDCDPMPTKMDVDYTYGRLSIGGGGFVSGLMSDAATGVKYARTDVGGAYKWNAADCSWKQLLNFVSEANAGLLSVESFATDPNNANNLYLLCGSEYLSSQKTAVLYSNDGGATFKESDLNSLPIYVHGNGDGRNNGERIAVDPNNGKVLLVGGRLGKPLAMSTDGAKTWTAVTTFPSVYTSSASWPAWESTKQPTTDNQNGISSVVFDGSQKLSNGNTARIFVGVSRSSAANVYKTEDGGATWTVVSTLPTTYMPLRMKMDPDGNLLIVYADKCVGGSAGAIYRYNPNTDQAFDITPAKGLPFGDVIVSPKNSKKLVASTNNKWVSQKWENAQSANGDIIYTSTDGGTTWRSLQDSMVLTNNGVTWVPGYALHWCGSMCFDPSNDSKVSFASGNGIFTCNNVWCKGIPTFYFDVNGLEETVALDMVSIPGGNPQSVIGDYTGFNHTSVSEFAPIHVPSPGTSNGIAYAAGNTKVMARVSKSEWSSQTSYYSEDGGKTWSAMKNPSGIKVALSADGSTVVIVTSGGSLQYSTDKGQTFSSCTGASTVSYVAADPVNSKYFYAAADGKIYISSDGGKSFSASTSLTNNTWTRLCVVPDHEGLIYAPCGAAGLEVSTDHGATFSAVSGISSCEAVGNGIGKDGDSYVLYVWGSNADHTGLLRSEDKGATWQIINDDTHQFGGPGNGQFVIGDQNHYGRFYMSTLGMGIVYGDLAANYEAPTWNCFTDNTTCASTDVETVAAVDENSIVTPNPFTTSCSMDENGDYAVLNVLGSVIERGHYTSGARLGANWPAGVYFVRINGNVVRVIKR